VGKINRKVKTFFAPAGSLILVDTRGIHRGRPLYKNGERYALTNYYWHKDFPPLHIQKLVTGNITKLI
jgi:hypothetical protein